MGLSFSICKMEREDGSEGPSSTRRRKENYICTLSCLSPSSTVGSVLSLRKFTQSSNLDLSTLPSLPYQLTDRWSQAHLWWPWVETHLQSQEGPPLRSRP